MESRFQSAKIAASGIEGMLSEFSMAVMDCLLSFQEENKIEGNIAEFGVLRGRSAAILGSHASFPERLILVDVEDRTDRGALARICPHLEFVLCSSENFKASFRDYKAIKHRCRFIHIDSSHAYRTTLSEMKLADSLMQSDGIVALDDFTNLNYSQILAAMYKHIFTTWTPLTVFLVTNEKAYLCNKRNFNCYGRFVLDRLIDEMERRGVSNLAIARTDIDPEYKAFYLRPLLKGEEGKYYGPNLYMHLYQDP